MAEFYPSEIARLVLGYLKEVQCLNSWQTFFDESIDLQEHKRLYSQGRFCTTNVNGKSLLDILAEYCTLKNVANENNQRSCSTNTYQIYGVYKTPSKVNESTYTSFRINQKIQTQSVVSANRSTAKSPSERCNVFTSPTSRPASRTPRRKLDCTAVNLDFGPEVDSVNERNTCSVSASKRALFSCITSSTNQSCRRNIFVSTDNRSSCSTITPNSQNLSVREEIPNDEHCKRTDNETMDNVHLSSSDNQKTGSSSSAKIASASESDPYDVQHSTANTERCATSDTPNSKSSDGGLFNQHSQAKTSTSATTSHQNIMFQTSDITVNADENTSVSLMGSCSTPQYEAEPPPYQRAPDTNSPRICLSHDRSLLPSLTTPVKDRKACPEEEWSPKRKGCIPRRRLLSESSMSKLNHQPEAVITFDSMIESLFAPDEVLFNDPLVQLLTENINKVKQCELKESDFVQDVGLDDIVKKAAEYTEEDPAFERFLNTIIGNNKDLNDFNLGSDSAVPKLTDSSSADVDKHESSVRQANENKVSDDVSDIYVTQETVKQTSVASECTIQENKGHETAVEVLEKFQNIAKDNSHSEDDSNKNEDKSLDSQDKAELNTTTPLNNTSVENESDSVKSFTMNPNEDNNLTTDVLPDSIMDKHVNSTSCISDKVIENGASETDSAKNFTANPNKDNFACGNPPDNAMDLDLNSERCKSDEVIKSGTLSDSPQTNSVDHPTVSDSSEVNKHVDGNEIKHVSNNDEDPNLSESLPNKASSTKENKDGAINNKLLKDKDTGMTIETELKNKEQSQNVSLDTQNSFQSHNLHNVNPSTTEPLTITSQVASTTQSQNISTDTQNTVNSQVYPNVSASSTNITESMLITPQMPYQPNALIEVPLPSVPAYLISSLAPDGTVQSNLVRYVINTPLAFNSPSANGVCLSLPTVPNTDISSPIIVTSTPTTMPVYNVEPLANSVIPSVNTENISTPSVSGMSNLHAGFSQNNEEIISSEVSTPSNTAKKSAKRKKMNSKDNSVDLIDKNSDQVKTSSASSTKTTKKGRAKRSKPKRPPKRKPLCLFPSSPAVDSNATPTKIQNKNSSPDIPVLSISESPLTSNQSSACKLLSQITGRIETLERSPRVEKLEKAPEAKSLERSPLLKSLIKNAAALTDKSLRLTSAHVRSLDFDSELSDQNKNKDSQIQNAKNIEQHCVSGKDEVPYRRSPRLQTKEKLTEPIEMNELDKRTSVNYPSSPASNQKDLNSVVLKVNSDHAELSAFRKVLDVFNYEDVQILDDNSIDTANTNAGISPKNASKNTPTRVASSDKAFVIEDSSSVHLEQNKNVNESLNKPTDTLEKSKQLVVPQVSNTEVVLDEKQENFAKKSRSRQKAISSKSSDCNVTPKKIQELQENRSSESSVKESKNPAKVSSVSPSLLSVNPNSGERDRNHRLSVDKEIKKQEISKQRENKNKTDKIINNNYKSMSYALFGSDSEFTPEKNCDSVHKHISPPYECIAVNNQKKHDRYNMKSEKGVCDITEKKIISLADRDSAAFNITSKHKSRKEEIDLTKNTSNDAKSQNISNNAKSQKSPEDLKSVRDMKIVECIKVGEHSEIIAENTKPCENVTSDIRQPVRKCDKSRKKSVEDNKSVFSKERDINPINKESTPQLSLFSKNCSKLLTLFSEGGQLEVGSVENVAENENHTSISFQSLQQSPHTQKNPSSKSTGDNLKSSEKCTPVEQIDTNKYSPKNPSPKITYGTFKLNEMNNVVEQTDSNKHSPKSSSNLKPKNPSPKIDDDSFKLNEINNVVEQTDTNKHSPKSSCSLKSKTPSPKVTGNNLKLNKKWSVFEQIDTSKYSPKSLSNLKSKNSSPKIISNDPKLNETSLIKLTETNKHSPKSSGSLKPSKGKEKNILTNTKKHQKQDTPDSVDQKMQVSTNSAQTKTQISNNCDAVENKSFQKVALPQEKETNLTHSKKHHSSNNTPCNNQKKQVLANPSPFMKQKTPISSPAISSTGNICDAEKNISLDTGTYGNISEKTNKGTDTVLPPPKKRIRPIPVDSLSNESFTAFTKFTDLTETGDRISAENQNEKELPEKKKNSDVYKLDSIKSIDKSISNVNSPASSAVKETPSISESSDVDNYLKSFLTTAPAYSDAVSPLKQFANTLEVKSPTPKTPVTKTPVTKTPTSLFKQPWLWKSGKPRAFLDYYKKANPEKEGDLPISPLSFSNSSCTLDGFSAKRKLLDDSPPTPVESQQTSTLSTSAHDELENVDIGESMHEKDNNFIKQKKIKCSVANESIKLSSAKSNPVFSSVDELMHVEEKADEMVTLDDEVFEENDKDFLIKVKRKRKRSDSCLSDTCSTVVDLQSEVETPIKSDDWRKNPLFSVSPRREQNRKNSLSNSDYESSPEKTESFSCQQDVPLSAKTKSPPSLSKKDTEVSLVEKCGVNESCKDDAGNTSTQKDVLKTTKKSVVTDNSDVKKTDHSTVLEKSNKKDLHKKAFVKKLFKQSETEMKDNSKIKDKKSILPVKKGRRSRPSLKITPFKSPCKKKLKEKGQTPPLNTKMSVENTKKDTLYSTPVEANISLKKSVKNYSKHSSEMTVKLDDHMEIKKKSDSKQENVIAISKEVAKPSSQAPALKVTSVVSKDSHEVLNHCETTRDIVESDIGRSNEEGSELAIAIANCERELLMRTGTNDSSTHCNLQYSDYQISDELLEKGTEVKSNKKESNSENHQASTDFQSPKFQANSQFDKNKEVTVDDKESNSENLQTAHSSKSSINYPKSGFCTPKASATENKKNTVTNEKSLTKEVKSDPKFQLIMDKLKLIDKNTLAKLFENLTKDPT